MHPAHPTLPDSPAPGAFTMGGAERSIPTERGITSREAAPPFSDLKDVLRGILRIQLAALALPFFIAVTASDPDQRWTCTVFLLVAAGFLVLGGILVGARVVFAVFLDWRDEHHDLNAGL